MRPDAKGIIPPSGLISCNPAGIGSDKNVTPRVHCHISAAIARIDIGPRPVRGYFEHGGSIRNVAVDSVETDPQRNETLGTEIVLDLRRGKLIQNCHHSPRQAGQVRRWRGRLDLIKPEAKVVSNRRPWRIYRCCRCRVGEYRFPVRSRARPWGLLSPVAKRPLRSVDCVNDDRVGCQVARVKIARRGRGVRIENEFGRTSEEQNNDIG